MRSPSKQRVIVLDVEGVLMPEVWVKLAELTGVDQLRRTTRDEPDYDALMQYRLQILRERSLTMPIVAEALADIKPLDGAREFLDDLRNDYQVVLLSDTFEQYACAMMPHLGLPTIFCHRLVVDGDAIVDYELRIDDHKRRTVDALRGLNFHVSAGGDSFNDLSMLRAADSSCLFHAPEAIVSANPQFYACDDYASFRDWINQASL